MILLDTNVVSELMRRQSDQTVVEWLGQQARVSLWISAVTLMEIRYGLQAMSGGRRQIETARSFERLLSGVLGNRVAPFDGGAAEQTASLMASRRARGRTGELKDSMIAGIAIANRATLATRNTTHFEDLPVPVVNPWAA